MGDVNAEQGLVVGWISGNCPVEAEGIVDGQEFYFRSRGSRWSMSIGGPDVIGKPDWYHEERYGNWPDAGWISEDEARAFIDKAVGLYRSALIAQAEQEASRHG